MAKKPLQIALIKQAVVAAEANRRQGTSHVKTRGEVSGGGKKPWRQKGTGRARAGSSRSPLWIGGGITFGPRRERNHKLKLPKVISRAAIAEIFTHLKDNDQVIVADKLGLTEVKTKNALALLKKHGADNKIVTIITAEIEPELVLACRNLPTVTVVENRNVSILNLAHTELVLIDNASAKIRGLVKEVVAEKKPVTAAKAEK